MTSPILAHKSARPLPGAHGFAPVPLSLLMLLAGAGAACATVPSDGWWNSTDRIDLAGGENWTINNETHENAVTGAISIANSASVSLTGSALGFTGSTSIANEGTLSLTNSTLTGVSQIDGAGGVVLDGSTIATTGTFSAGSLKVNGTSSLATAGNIVVNQVKTDGDDALALKSDSGAIEFGVVIGSAQNASLVLSAVDQEAGAAVTIAQLDEVKLTIGKGVTAKFTDTLSTASPSNEAVTIHGTVDFTGLADQQGQSGAWQYGWSVKSGGTLRIAAKDAQKLMLMNGTVLEGTADAPAVFDMTGGTGTVDTKSFNFVTDRGYALYKATDLVLSNENNQDLAINATSRLETETLKLKDSIKLSSGSLIVTKSLDLDGESLSVASSWGKSSAVTAFADIGGASASGIVVNGGLIVGENALASIGTTDTNLLTEKAGTLSQNGTTAALGLYSPISIASGGVLSVGSSASTANTASFAAGSLLVINGEALNDTAAITFENKGTVDVANGAKLCIVDAVSGGRYTIAANADLTFEGGEYGDETVTGWKGANLTAGSALLTVEALYDKTTGNLVITTYTYSGDMFPSLSDGMSSAVDALYEAHEGEDGSLQDYADVGSSDAGVRFLSRATNTLYLGTDTETAARTIESAARIALAGAVPQMTMAASDATGAAVIDRFSRVRTAGGARLAQEPDDGTVLWVAPTWQNRKASDLEAGALEGGWRGNLGGVVVGADHGFGSLRTGMTLSAGTGYAHSSGDYARTTNHLAFWGLGLYAGWQSGGFALTADAGYTATRSKLSQAVDARMDMSGLSARVHADAWQAGLRVEHAFETSVLDVIPHAGVRYLNLRTEGFDASSGGTVLETDDMTQNLWTFPVGVTVSKALDLGNGRHLLPSADFTVIPAAGDLDASQSVRFTGLPGVWTMTTETTDRLTWQGRAGVEYTGGDFAFGFNYTLQAGETGTGHGLFASLRYGF